MMPTAMTMTMTLPSDLDARAVLLLPSAFERNKEDERYEY